jgi:hypothetical protein
MATAMKLRVCRQQNEKTLDQIEAQAARSQRKGAAGDCEAERATRILKGSTNKNTRC